MPWTITDLTFGLLLPAGVTATVFVILSHIATRFPERAMPDHGPDFFAAPVALGAGFEAGYWSLDLGPIVPSSHWHWLPYVVAGGAVCSLVGRTFPLRGLVFLACAVAGAFLLTPTWDDLQPARYVYLAVWPLLVTSTAIGIEAWFDSTRDQRRMEYPVVLVVTFLSASILLLLSDNLRFSHMAIAMLGASAGMWMVSFFPRDQDSRRGTALPVAIGVWALMLVGGVNTFSAIPLLSWLLIPLAPTGLWIGVLPRVRELSAVNRLTVSLGPSLLACAVAIAAAFWAVRDVFE